MFLRGQIPLRMHRFHHLALQRLYSDVTIGDVTVKISPATNTELVPFGFLSKFGDLTSPDLIAHMRWIAQKHVIGQDTFLLSHPGTPLTRNLIFGKKDTCVAVSSSHPVPYINTCFSTLLIPISTLVSLLYLSHFTPHNTIPHHITPHHTTSHDSLCRAL